MSQSPAGPLHFAQEALGFHTWTWDIERDASDWLPDPSPLFGMPVGTAPPNFTFYLEHVHPEDRAKAREVFVSCLKGERPSYRHEERIVWADGSVHWVETYGRGFYGTDGRATTITGIIRDITERKRLETALAEANAELASSASQFQTMLEALRVSEARFRNLVELSSDWYWEQDAELRFVSTEGRQSGRGGISAQEHFGKRRWELPGTEIVGQSWEQHRADLAQRKVFRDLLLKRTSESGSVHYISVSGEPIVAADGSFRGYRGFTRDVTEGKRVEDELRSSRKLLEQVIDAIPMSIFAKDLDSRYVMVNRYMAEFFGTSKAALLMHHTSELPSTEATRRQSLRDDQWVYRHRQALVHETWIQKPDGTSVPFHSSKIPLFDDGGALSGLLGINRDTTGQIAAQEKLREMNASLEKRVLERTAELEATLKELEAFSYSVSHDLRSPLGIISGFAHMVAKDEADRLSDEGRRKLGVVEANANKMSMLVDDLLALSRLTRTVLAQQDVDLRAMAATAAEELRQQYPRALVEIGRLPLANGDPTLLRQMLVNLIDNALKYSSKVEAPRVEAGWDAAQGAWFVRDNGAGFDMRYAAKLFGTFERLHTDAEFPGTGVGLAIVKRIAERHGGRVWATGEPGKGATFYFTLRPKQTA